MKKEIQAVNVHMSINPEFCQLIQNSVIESFIFANNFLDVKRQNETTDKYNKGHIDYVVYMAMIHKIAEFYGADSDDFLLNKFLSDFRGTEDNPSFGPGEVLKALNSPSLWKHVDKFRSDDIPF